MVAVRGRPMTTGAHEVTTVDDFNIRVCWEEVMVEEP